MLSRNERFLRLSKTILITAILLSLAALVQGCAPGPTATVTMPEQTPLPPSPSSTPLPRPSATPTLALIDGGVFYLAVGLNPGQNLPIFQEPSSDALQTGQIPWAGKNIRTTGVEFEGEGLVWLQIEYQATAGWVDLSRLAVQQGDLPADLIAQSHMAVFYLKQADYSSLAEIIHPDLCLRFSPYPYLRENDQVFCADQLPTLPGGETRYLWGAYDGTGDPIQLSFDEYHQRFVYDADYLQSPVVGLNQEVSAGNALNNIPEIYPDGMIVEYHFPGFDPQYGGMDWRSLRLVFIQEGGEWFLVALVHGEWTI